MPMATVASLKTFRESLLKTASKSCEGCLSCIYTHTEDASHDKNGRHSAKMASLLRRQNSFVDLYAVANGVANDLYTAYQADHVVDRVDRDWTRARTSVRRRREPINRSLFDRDSFP